MPASAEEMNKQSERTPEELFAPGSTNKGDAPPSFDQVTEKDGGSIRCLSQIKRKTKRVAESAGSAASRASNSAGSAVRQLVGSAGKVFQAAKKPSKKKSKKGKDKKKKVKQPGEDTGRQKNAETRQSKFNRSLLLYIRCALYVICTHTCTYYLLYSYTTDLKTIINAPTDIDEHLTDGKYCPVCIAIYIALKEHWDEVKDLRYKDGSYIYWTFPRLPWTRNRENSNLPFALMLNYCSLEEAGSLRDTQHCAFKTHSDGETLVSSTWNWIKGEFMSSVRRACVISNHQYPYKYIVYSFITIQICSMEWTSTER